MTSFRMLILVLASFLVQIGVSSSALAGYCAAQPPTIFICEWELDNKWESIEITYEDWWSGNDCTPCHVTSLIKLVPNGNTPSATIKEYRGEPGQLKKTGDSTNVKPNSGEVVFGEDITIECGTCVVHDVSYSAADCPTATPDGPGPCSIASATWCCDECVE